MNFSQGLIIIFLLSTVAGTVVPGIYKTVDRLDTIIRLLEAAK